MGVRAEVAHALALGAAHHLQPRDLLVQRDREPGIALVVAVLDVEARVELLDPGVFELSASTSVETTVQSTARAVRTICSVRG